MQFCLVQRFQTEVEKKGPIPLDKTRQVKACWTTFSGRQTAWRSDLLPSPWFARLSQMCFEPLGNVTVLVSCVFYYFQHFDTQVARYKVFTSHRNIVKLLWWVGVPEGSRGDRRKSLLTMSADVIRDHDS